MSDVTGYGLRYGSYGRERESKARREGEREGEREREIYIYIERERERESKARREGEREGERERERERERGTYSGTGLHQTKQTLRGGEGGGESISGTTVSLSVFGERESVTSNGSISIDMNTEVTVKLKKLVCKNGEIVRKRGGWLEKAKGEKTKGGMKGRKLKIQYKKTTPLPRHAPCNPILE